MYVKNIKNMKFIFKIYNNINFFFTGVCYSQFHSNFVLIRCYQFKFQHFQRYNPINDVYQLPQVGNFQSFAQLIGSWHPLWAVCMSAIDNCLVHNLPTT